MWRTRAYKKRIHKKQTWNLFRLVNIQNVVKKTLKFFTIYLYGSKFPRSFVSHSEYLKGSDSFFRYSRKRRRKRASSVTKHYVAHKEDARVLIHARLAYWNQFYNLSYNRVAIRNQRRCWGSCTSLSNLNFNYKILFLPPHLQDYIVVHELCHLAELNHGKAFWDLVATQLPSYKTHMQELRAIERKGMTVYLAEIKAEERT